MFVVGLPLLEQACDDLLSNKTKSIHDEETNKNFENNEDNNIKNSA